MLAIKVLGPGCQNCERLADLAAQAVELLRISHPGLEASIDKVIDRAVFIDYGLLTTPGLVVNERLVSSGRIPALSQITGWLEEALSEGEPA